MNGVADVMSPCGRKTASAVCALRGRQHHVAPSTLDVLLRFALQSCSFKGTLWNNFDKTVQYYVYTVCKPCVGKRPWNNCSFPTAAVFPLGLHVPPAGKLTN